MKIRWLILGLLGGVALASDLPAPRGTLVFADGNRITGRWVSDGVFMSDRFGVVRFEPAEARFEPASGAPYHDSLGGLRERVEAEVQAGTSAPAKPVPPPWHPWKFSVSGFADSTLEGGERRREYYGGIRVDRPLTRQDQVSLDLRYEYRRKGDRLDRRRGTATGEWRHSFGDSRWFSLFRPKGEYDGRNLDAEQQQAFGRTRLDYLFTHQQGGIGYRLLDSKQLKSNVVAGWNWFYIHVYHLGSLDADAPSVSLEHDLRLPWGLEIKQVGQAYLVPSSGDLAWENTVDFTKHLTSHVYVTLRHEHRKDYVLRNANPLDRLRLLFGLKF